jgi:hypothetical protein
VEDAIPQGNPSEGVPHGHEDTLIPVRGLVISAVALVVVIIASEVILGLWTRAFTAEEKKVEALHPGRQNIDVTQFPQPRLQESPPVDMVQLAAEEKARISSYGWIDKKAGIARIPVDRAMDILAKRGLPKVAAPPPAPGTPPNTSIPPAGKREEAGPEENRPAPEKKAGLTPAETKRGGTP